jgi:spore coat polysaccharide biosynthesis protein SpsF|tara:strand:+ start:1059 stop:1763 length:705 start_codon:yes stop_codon:yes gene_type:complete
MKVVGIIQARMDSSRFPEKMMASLGDLSIIEWVILRVKKAKFLDNIVLATSNEKQDDYLINVANKYEIQNYRGSKLNVLNRVVEAATQYKADHVVRICADNPFICFDEIDDLIEYYKTSECDLAFNHSPLFNSNFADGFGAEILSSKTLYEISKEIVLSSHKEHVTKYLYDNNKKFNICSPPCPSELSFPHFKFDIDKINDLKKLNHFLNTYKIKIDTSAKDILKSYAKHYLEI